MSDLLDINGQENEFDAGAVDTIDQGSVEGGGPSYPVIQWAYGSDEGAQARWRGWLWRLLRQGREGRRRRNGNRRLDQDQPHVRERHRGGRLLGSARRNQHCSRAQALGKSILATVSARFSPGAASTRQRKPTAARRRQSRTHYLVLVKGLEQAGPFVLTMKAPPVQRSSPTATPTASSAASPTP